MDVVLGSKCPVGQHGQTLQRGTIWLCGQVGTYRCGHLSDKGLPYNNLSDYSFRTKPAIFCNRWRNLDGMSEPIFSPEMTLFTLSSGVRPRRSIRMPLSLSYLCVRKGYRSTSLTSDATSPESAAQVRLYRSSSSVIWCKSNCGSI